MKKMISTSSRFLRSALEVNGIFNSNNQILSWIQERKNKVKVNINQTKLSKLTQWKYDEGSGSIEHISGKFFKIEGLEVQIETIDGQRENWSQPIINQPEIGYLGCIVKEFEGVLYFLVQAKIEPGNSNIVQISPTLQATRSNYTQAHKGKKPRFLEYFNGTQSGKILVDQLQSEQGARFLKKRNRNMIVEVREEIDIPQDFKWITLGQIKNLIGKDNIVNMDLRTVISCIPFDGVEGDTYFKNLEHQTNLSLEGSMLQSAIKPSIQNGQIVEILSWLANMKSKTDLLLKKRSLQDLPNWNLTENKISHKNGLFFDILWVDVEIMHREVAEWNQPIVAPCGQGIICFIVKKINGIYHFLAQAELECGNFDMYEIGPTVACVKDNHPKKPIPYLDYILNAKKEQVLFDSCNLKREEDFFMRKTET